jgi:hypothetical protein
MDWLHRRGLETGFVFQDFPARRNEFPVSLQREISHDGGGKAAESWSRLRRESPVSKDFPVFSLLISAMVVETSSLQTASTAIESARAEIPARSVSRLERTRDCAGFCESTFANPKRRQPRGQSGCGTAALFLYGRLRRFGMKTGLAPAAKVSPSPEPARSGYLSPSTAVSNHYLRRTFEPPETKCKCGSANGEIGPGCVFAY